MCKKEKSGRQLVDKEGKVQSLLYFRIEKIGRGGSVWIQMIYEVMRYAREKERQRKHRREGKEKEDIGGQPISVTDTYVHSFLQKNIENISIRYKEKKYAIKQILKQLEINSLKSFSVKICQKLEKFKVKL